MVIGLVAGVESLATFLNKNKMPIYSADQIVEKTLFAKAPVNLKRTPQDNAATIYTVKAGDRVGTVYSWLDVKQGERNNLYWMFYDQNNRPYFAEHKEGLFNIQDLKEQGALTVKEQLAAKAKADEKTKDFVERMIKLGMVGLIGFGIVKAFIDKKVK